MNQLRKPLTFKTAFHTYTADRLVGEGGCGRVYHAEDDCGNDVAIKLLAPEKTTRERLKRFENEYRFGHVNKHPNVLTVYDYGLHEEKEKPSPFFVMPFYSKSLRNLLEEGSAREEALQFFSQILDGVETAHRREVIHRDLKPENILYDQDNHLLIVADFGIAHFSQEELYTLVETGPNTRLANFLYSAPEQRRRGQEVDRRADIFALGLILNELFIGEVPQGTAYKTIGSVSPDHAYLDELVERMLSQNPEERPGSIGEIKGELKARGAEFVHHQRISELGNKVIDVGEIDDPLVSDPPRVVDFDWDPSRLKLTLSQPVNDKWISALGKAGDRAVWGKGPEKFHITGNTATIQVPENQIQTVIDFFKEWLPRTAPIYKKMLESERTEAERQERDKIQRERERLEQIERVRKNIKI